MGASVLYATYTGFMEPLGQSQILQYLLALSKDHQITLLSYEKGEDLDDPARFRSMKERLAANGIHWTPLRYHKAPTVPATAYDVSIGILVGAWLVLRRKVRILHARSYVASLVLLPLKWLFCLRYVFDMRGFWPEEMIDSGNWRKGTPLYLLAKWWEKRFLLGADVVIVLTKTAIGKLKEFPYLKGRPVRYEHVTTCVNTALFYPMPHDVEKSFILGCVGSVRMWYMFDDMLECFNILRQARNDARLLILNRGDHAYIAERLRAAGIDPALAEVKTVEHERVASEMARMAAGVFFIHPYPSKRGCAPTKLAEFLSCGIPCLVNAGVGEYEGLIESSGVGAVIADMSPQAKRAGVEKILRLAASPETRGRCAETARREFSLESGVALYDRVYRSLTI